MPKRSAVDVECGEDQEAADARLAASLQQAFDDTSRPRRRPAVDPALPFAVPELRRVGPRSHTHRFAGKKVPHGVAARSGAPGDLLAAVPDTGASQAHSAGGDSPAAEGGASAPGGAAAGLLSGGGAAPGVPPPQRHPKAVRPPRRAHFDKGCLVWARLPGVPVRWPGRIWMLKHTRKTHELQAARVPLARLVKMAGDSSFAWVTDDDLEAHVPGGPSCEALLEALSTLGKSKGSSRLGMQARRAVREVMQQPALPFVPPWRADSDSEADEAAAEAAAAAVTAHATRAADAEAVAAALAETTARDGLTPDWIIDVSCDIFGLERPSVEHPVILGLVDPCTNNKRFPNIPAELLYDRQDDGLAIRNSWAGHHAVVNPPYEASTQWRFINRCINEVEWGRCPGIIIICRNSTDTGYFQRLRPFPRCLLRRDAIRFKDYPDKTPIAFGICVFLLCRDPALQAVQYPRFVDAFASRGEVNLPIDGIFVRTTECAQLLARLHAQSVDTQRDSWVCCDACGRWRSLPPGADVSALAEVAWTCADRYPTGCAEPLSRREMKAFFYTVKEADEHNKGKDGDLEDQFPVPGHEDSRTLAALEDVQVHIRGTHARSLEQHDLELAKALQNAELRRRGLRSEADGPTSPVPGPTAGGARAAHHHHHRRARVSDVSVEPTSPMAAVVPEAPLTEFERQRLERIAVNQERLASLLRPTPDTPAEAAARREQHAAAATAAARRVRDEAEAAAARAAATAGHATVTAAAAHAAAAEASDKARLACQQRDAAMEAAARARDDLERAMAKHTAAMRECDALASAAAPEVAAATQGLGSAAAQPEVDMAAAP